MSKNPFLGLGLRSPFLSFSRVVVANLNLKLVVGAIYQDNYKGAIFIYDADGTNPIKVNSSDTSSFDKFAIAVAIGNDKIGVGMQLADDAGESSGSVYVYNLDGTGEVKITASDGAPYENFGSSVAVGGDKIYVGAEQANNDDDTYTSIGAIYIYNLDGTGEVKIPNPNQTSSNAQAQFGFSVAIG